MLNVELTIGGTMSSKSVEEGTKLSNLGIDVETQTVHVNDARVTRDMELRDGDEIEVTVKSGKQG